MQAMAHLRDQFYLDQNITFLNFGSFGACPKPIFEDYQKWQIELEREPVQFITVNGLKYLQNSREALAQYLSCDADDLVYCNNPSFAVNTIARSIGLKAGDEVLSTNIEYGACDKVWQYYCEQQGAKYIRQKINLPLTNKNQFIDDFFKGLSAKTKLIFISHITSSTALILPVQEICDIAKSKGILTFVDGAHAPAQVELNLSSLNADFYTGACHKWMMTPKGCSFLYVNRQLQASIDPLVISWGYKSAFPSHSLFLDYHQMQGTRDFSAFLTVPKALAFMKENNWQSVSAACKQLVRQNAERFCALFNTKALAPITEEFIGQMFSLPIQCEEPEKLQRLLFEKYHIEIPVMRMDAQVFIRYSINAFNSQEDLDILYKALEEIKSQTNLFGVN